MSGAAQPQATKIVAGSAPELDIQRVRADFPALHQLVNGKPLVYLDSAASSQKPNAVIDAVADFYRHDFANIHRGAHTLSGRSTDAYEAARAKVQRFINAADPSEVVFVRGCTEAINLVAATYGPQNVGPGDEVLVTEMEHHSNLVPWQQLCQQQGAALRVIPLNDDGQLRLDMVEQLFSSRTRLLAVTHVSNALGTIAPIAALVERAHAHGARVLIDGAQAVVHMSVDVQAIDADFYVFSGHKLYGPTGIGVLYGKRELLDGMPPYQTGGGMVDIVQLESTTFIDAPLRFEAGTPHIAGAVGLGVAVDYLTALGMRAVTGHEQALLAYATAALAQVPKLRLIGTAADKTGVLSFTLEAAHPADIATLLDQQGVAIRAGHHCAQPVMRRFGLPGTARASLGVYNTTDDIDALVRGLHKVIELFA